MTTRKKILLFAVILSVPFSFFIIPFVCGFYFLSVGYIFLSVPCFVFGPPTAGFIVASLVPASALKRTAIGIATMFLLWASYFLFPAGGKGLAIGLSENFKLTKNPAETQQWAIRVLDQYEAGTLETTTNGNVEDLLGGGAQLQDRDIPPQIKNLWPLKPSIGIMAISDNGWLMGPIRTNTIIMPELTGGQPIPMHLTHCVSICWEDRGLLVGRQDFESKWDPRGGGFLCKTMPGVYTFWVGH